MLIIDNISHRGKLLSNQHSQAQSEATGSINFAGNLVCCSAGLIFEEAKRPNVLKTKKQCLILGPIIHD